jgi:exopolyphosphatase/guanosine-5'-triphosphate,3'-diphosphate pyrophosphatase
MKVSIIDIGTQSLKHYIFDVTGGEKKVLFYKRHSDAHLGNNNEITQKAIERNLQILQACLDQNKKENVEKVELLGTDILRKAENARVFLARAKAMAGREIHVISQELEAKYLYEGFISIVPDDFHFAALNIGGGSTEVVVGSADRMEKFVTLPFGVKLLRSEFASGEQVNWKGLDDYLEEAITMDALAENVFITGALDFISAAGPSLGVEFRRMTIPHHPFSLPLKEYQTYIDTLRTTSVDDLKKLYPKDPGFCDNLALGQSVYLAIAKKLSAKLIIPSRNDLTDGVVYQMLRDMRVSPKSS